jgi:hypothetical protein
MAKLNKPPTPSPAPLPRDRKLPWPADPVVDAYKLHVDRTLLRENLRKTPEERILALMELQRLAEEARRAGRKLRS